jgi:hypothetical protein
MDFGWGNRFAQPMYSRFADGVEGNFAIKPGQPGNHE